MEYDGTNYHGWQSQTNADTVQDVLENAIEKLFQESIRSTAAGRTDSGVHARGQVVNFLITKDLPLRKILLGLNAHLPEDIVVKNVEEVPLKFNSRFDAKRRVYQYYMMFQHTAIYRKYCWQFLQKINTDLLQPMADMLKGEHDYSAFAKLETHPEDNICHVYESRWYQQDGFFIYRIMANRFINGMARGIVGTMIDVASGRFASDMFEDIFHSQDRSKAGGSAPARGLFLEEVIY